MDEKPTEVECTRDLVRRKQRSTFATPTKQIKDTCISWEEKRNNCDVSSDNKGNEQVLSLNPKRSEYFDLVACHSYFQSNPRCQRAAIIVIRTNITGNYLVPRPLPEGLCHVPDPLMGMLQWTGTFSW